MRLLNNALFFSFFFLTSLQATPPVIQIPATTITIPPEVERLINTAESATSKAVWIMNKLPSNPALSVLGLACGITGLLMVRDSYKNPTATSTPIKPIWEYNSFAEYLKEVRFLPSQGEAGVIFIGLSILFVLQPRLIFG